MGSGQKPAISISLKPVGGSDRTYLMAGWEHGGKVSSLLLDRKVKALKVQMEDGTVVTVTRTDDGKSSHYIDIFDNRQSKKDPDDQVPPGDDEW